MKKVTFIFILLYSILSYSQSFWQQINGPYGGTVYSIAINSKGDIFAGTIGGIFLSKDNGNTWSKTSFPAYYAFGIVINSKGDIFVRTQLDGLYISTDNGITWLHNSFDFGSYFLSMAVTPSGYIFIGNGDGVIFRSTNNGISWSKTQISYNRISALAVALNGNILAGVGGILYSSSDNGNSWVPSSTLPDWKFFNSITLNAAGKIFAATDWGIYSFNGENWILLSEEFKVEVIAVNSNGYIYAASNGGMLRSTDNGNSWAKLNYAYNTLTIAMNSKGEIFAGVFSSGVLKSVDYGTSWFQINNGLNASDIRSFVINSKGQLFAGTAEGVFSSDNNGVTWKKTKLNEYVNSLCVTFNGHLLAGTSGGLFRSNNNGKSWTRVNVPGSDHGISMVTGCGKELFAVSSEGISLMRSKGNGNSWTGIFTNVYIFDAAVNANGDIFVGTELNGIFRSTDDGKSWVNLSLPPIDDIYSVYSILFDKYGDVIAASNNGILRSTDNGNSWNPIHFSIGSLLINSQGVIYGANNAGIYKSDNGITWTMVSAFNNLSLGLLAMDSEGYLYAASYGGGILRSTATLSKNNYAGSDNSMKTFSLLQNYPNPFNPSTTIKYSIVKDGLVRLNIYDMLGSRIASVVDEYQPAGDYSVQFNGSGLASGIYLYRLESGGSFITRKFIIMK